MAEIGSYQRGGLARWLRCFKKHSAQNWSQGRVVWWYHIRFACGGTWAQSPACPFDRQRLMKSCVGSSAKAWRRLDHINVVGQLGGCDASERPMLRIGFEGAWCKWYHIRFACRRPRAQSPACPFYRQRLMKSSACEAYAIPLHHAPLNPILSTGSPEASQPPSWPTTLI